MLQDASSFKKAALEKKKNEEDLEESWVQCDHCEGWVHQICGMFNKGRNNPDVHYMCPECLLTGLESGRRQKIEVKVGFGSAQGRVGGHPEPHGRRRKLSECWGGCEIIFAPLKLFQAARAFYRRFLRCRVISAISALPISGCRGMPQSTLPLYQRFLRRLLAFLLSVARAMVRGKAALDPRLERGAQHMLLAVPCRLCTLPIRSPG